jgi:hypothetical protein
MSNRRANDDDGAEGSLAHNAGWSDVWAGLLLTLFLLGSAILVAILSSRRTSSRSFLTESANPTSTFKPGPRGADSDGSDPAGLSPSTAVSSAAWGVEENAAVPLLNTVPRAVLRFITRCHAPS